MKIKVGLAVSTLTLMTVSAYAQQAANAPPPADESLPAVEVIQETPAQKAARAKKKSAPVAPVSAAPVTPAPAADGSQNAAGEAFGTESTAKVPSAVSTVTSEDMARSGDVNVTDALMKTVPGVILQDAQGNEFQRTIDYRGFSSGPVNGQAQGLAVYQNGVRINESFGDIVNWDFLPSNAIDSISIVGANPVFGLNAIGGAAVINMRNGFNFQGVEIDARAGSFGRYQGSVAAGAKSGNYAAFIAYEGISDDGYRNFSESTINRFYADLGFKNSTAEFHINFTGAKNNVGVVAATPVELLDVDYKNVFTGPQTTENELAMVSVNGNVKATNTLTFGGTAYYRAFNQKHDDGNIAEASSCNNGVDNFAVDRDGNHPPGASAPAANRAICLEDNEYAEGAARNVLGTVITRGDVTAAMIAGGLPGYDNGWIGTIDRTSQDARSLGGSIQAEDKQKLLGFNNQFIIGASYDHGEVDYAGNSELGYLNSQFQVTGFGSNFILNGPEDYLARSLNTQNDYVGVYVLDTLDLTKQLSVTVGGRYNYARLELEDLNGNFPELTGTHTFERFNPTAGATYKIGAGLTAYGNYSEANRAPTPAELSCADPEQPCLIESFLTADPPLEQVVTKTWEAGFRGDFRTFNGGRVDWSMGVFRANNENDILSISAGGSRGYFLNAGETQRQGIELAAVYQDKTVSAYATYAYTDATYQTANEFSSPFNPASVQCSGSSDPEDLCVNVEPGDKLPGIPAHKFKAGIDYWLTSKWRVGADLTAASGQYFFGDEGNDSKPLAGYAKVDLHTSYDITQNIQIYGIVNNVFNQHYGIYGTYANLEAANEIWAELNGNPELTDSRTITNAAPITGYGGVKIKF